MTQLGVEITVVYAIFNKGVAGIVLSIDSTLSNVSTAVNTGANFDCLALSNCTGG